MVWYWLFYWCYLIFLKQFGHFYSYLVLHRTLVESLTEPRQFFVKIIILVLNWLQRLNLSHFHMQAHQWATPLVLVACYFLLGLMNGFDSFSHHLIDTFIHFLRSILQFLPSARLGGDIVGVLRLVILIFFFHDSVCFGKTIIIF